MKKKMLALFAVVLGFGAVSYVSAKHYMMGYGIPKKRTFFNPGGQQKMNEQVKTLVRARRAAADLSLDKHEIQAQRRAVADVMHHATHPDIHAEANRVEGALMKHPTRFVN